MAQLTLLQSVFPKRNSLHVPLDTTMTLNFSASMDELSLNNETIQLINDEQSHPLRFDYRPAYKQLKLIPIQSLKPNTSYELKLKGFEDGIRDVFGNVSGYNYTFPFSTVEQIVQKPEEEIETKEPDKPNEEDVPVDAETPVVDEKEESAPPSVSIPSHQLTVLSTYPEPGELIEVGTEVAVAFSHPIDVGSLTGNLHLKEVPISPLLEAADITGFTASLSENNTILRIKLPTLIQGNRYQLIIETGVQSLNGNQLVSNYHLSFTLMYPYFFTTIKAVRLMGGDFTARFSDNEIAELIGNVSQSTYNLAQRLLTFNDGQWTAKAGPFGVEQYVQYTVLYQIVIGQVLESSSGISRNISLGDLSVGDTSEVSSSIGDMLTLLKDEIDKWWRILQDDQAIDEVSYIKTPTSAVRSGDIAYPDFQTRVPFNDLGD